MADDAKRLAREVTRLGLKVDLRIKDDRVGPFGMGFGSKSLPIAGSHAQVVDTTGSRITVTRLALTGPFALALRKKTGEVKVHIISPDGTLTGTAKDSGVALEFAAAYNELAGVSEPAEA